MKALAKVYLFFILFGFVFIYQTFIESHEKRLHLENNGLKREKRQCQTAGWMRGHDLSALCPFWPESYSHADLFSNCPRSPWKWAPAARHFLRGRRAEMLTEKWACFSQPLGQYKDEEDSLA